MKMMNQVKDVHLQRTNTRDALRSVVKQNEEVNLEIWSAPLLNRIRMEVTNQ